MARRCELTDVDAQYGNNVSHSNRKSRRRFMINIQPVSLKSEVLRKTFHLRIAAKTLRSVEHNGGLDGFLLSIPASKLSEKAANMRRSVKKVLTANGQAPVGKKPAVKTVSKRVAKRSAAAKTSSKADAKAAA